MSSLDPASDRWRRQRWVVTAIGVVVALGAALVIAALQNNPPAQAAPPPLSPQTVRASATLHDQPCATGASGPFAPTSFAIRGVLDPVPILALPRDWRGVPSVPPISEAGKREVAWDRAPVGIMPGSSRGNALFNAHTWPWPQGGALGNIMLTNLHRGGVIVLRGNGVTQCYRVTKVVVTPAAGPYVGFYDRTGPSQIAIISCSGVRAGPGDWLSRTIWFASPFTDPAPTI